MQARALVIDRKLRTSPVALASPADFEVRDGGAFDARLLATDPRYSLYCVDPARRQALFAEVPAGCDVTAAPFLYQAQYEHAQRLVRVPYEVLHRLAAGIAPDPSRLVFIYSVGRCGSTLVSNAFGAVPGVESLSEPDVFTQLRDHWIAGGLEGKDKEKLLRSCLALQCAPGRARGATAWALKFRSNVMDLAPLLQSAAPGARVVFLYRNAVPWARSFLRFMGVRDEATAATRLDFLARRWLAAMELALDLHRRGVGMFVARYEELEIAPLELITALLAWCGLADRDMGGLAAALARDSQEGSAVSRENLGGSGVDMTPELVARLQAIMRSYAPQIPADSVIPGTYLRADR